MPVGLPESRPVGPLAARRPARAPGPAGGRPDLAAVVARANAQLGDAAAVLAGGPEPLLEGRAIGRVTWAM